MPTVAEILIEEGRNAQRARAASGQIWGGAVASAAQAPAQIIAQRREDQVRQQQDQYRQLQQREMEQNLAVGGARLDALQQDKMDEALTAQLVQQHSQLDPESGHLVTDHGAVAEGLTAKGRVKASERYADFATKNEEAINGIQTAHLAVEAKKSKWRADTIGAIVDAPENQQAGLYATVRGTLSPLAKQDPLLGQLPATYPGKDAIKALYESQLSDADRYARHTKAAEDRLKGLKEVPAGGTLVDTGDIDKTTGLPKVIATGPQTKHYEQKSVMLDGKPAEVHFDPSTGKHYDADGADVSARVKPIPPASTIVNPAALNDVKETVAGMKDGSLPPILPGRATKEYLATLAEAHRQKYDLASAATDWAATQKHISTMNGTQQLRLNQSINSLPEMLDKVDSLAAQWKGGRFPLLNKANLAAAKQGVYGQDVASVANKLDAQIADVTADLGNVYMGGNSPTDHALGLAAKSLSGDWSEKVLHDMTDLARQNVQIRSNSIKHTGVAGASATNPYGNQPDTSAIPANVADALNGAKPGRHTLSDGSVWTVNADGTVRK